MPHTDPISDLITRMRNAITAKHKSVSIPSSKLKIKILEILVKEGFVSSFRVMKNKEGKSMLDVELKYKPSGEPVIMTIKRISKPGLRTYSGYQDIPKVMSGFGVTILSTPKGIITDRMARRDKVGGELICTIC